MPLISSPHRFDVADLRGASPTTSGPHLSLLAGGLAAAGLAVVLGWGAAAIVSKALSDRPQDTAVLVAEAGWVAFSVLVAVIVWFGRKAGALDRDEARRAGSEQTMVLDETGVRLIGRWGESHTRWEGIARADWRDGDLVLTGRDGVLFLLPARAVPDEAWRRAADDLLEAHLAP